MRCSNRVIGSKSFVLANQTADKNGLLLLIYAIVDDVKFVLLIVYNCNTESQQLLNTDWVTQNATKRLQYWK